MDYFEKVSFSNANPRGGGDNRLNSIPAKAKHLNDLITKIHADLNSLGADILQQNGYDVNFVTIGDTNLNYITQELYNNEILPQYEAIIG